MKALNAVNAMQSPHPVLARPHSPRSRSWSIACALALSWTLAGAVLAGPPPPRPAGPGGPPGPFRSDLSPLSPTLRDLYPPELILENQGALAMTEDQIQALKKMLQDTHTASLDIQITLQRHVEALRNALRGPRVDEVAALAAADKVMQLESATKRTHLSMLIRIKNLLTPDQIRRIESLHPRGGPPRDRPE